ncbi:MAG TPA: superoxide dismutase, Ni [Candidatus Limnocylindrales bacterium]|nr:superoxide dismutase, Ni [Candidatus Limnocylindrales bacterium]
MSLREWISPARVVEAHCDLPCGVYDPEQARIEAESCLKIIEKYQASQDEVFRQRCIVIKEERAELAKHHIDVLWSDWYKPEKHDAKNPQIKEIFKQAAAQGSKVKATVDKAEAEKWLQLIDQIDEFWKANNGPAETRVKKAATAAR